MGKLLKSTCVLTCTIAGGLFLGTAIKTGIEAGSIIEGFKITTEVFSEEIKKKIEEYVWY